MFWGPCKGIFVWVWVQGSTIILSVALFLWPAFPSRLCSLSASPHHLSVSHHCEGRKPWRASQPDLFNAASSCMKCVCVCMCVHMGDNESVKEEKGRERRLDIFNSTAYLTWGLGEEAGRLNEIRGRHIARIHTHKHVYTLIPGVCSSLSAKWCYALILTLWVRPKPTSLSFLFSLSLLHFLSHFSPSLPLWLCLPPSSRLDGWLDSLGVFRFWRDPNFLF